MGQQWLEVDLAHLDDYDSHLMKLLQVRTRRRSDGGEREEEE